MLPVVSVDVMRRSDAACIAGGIAGRELMYRAGQALYACTQYIPPVAILCGTGNNAGDGYVLALLLAADGLECRLFLLEDKFSADGRYYFDQCVAQGIPYGFCSPHTTFEGYNTIVDCLFGTGYRAGADGVQGLARHCIQAVNAATGFVVSADINSGLDGDSGMAQLCVHSHLTASIGTYQYGHFLGMARDVMDAKCDLPIGIDLVDRPAWLVQEHDVADFLAPRPHLSHKGTYGYVALVGGSLRYSGAAKLANWSASAMRSGAGVVKLAVPRCITQAVAPYLLESTLYPLPDDGDNFVFDPAVCDDLVRNTRVVAVGMGLGNTPATRQLVLHLLQTYEGRLLLDADALNALAQGDLQPLRTARCRVFLTPHMGEMARLLAADGIQEAALQAQPVQTAQDFAARYGVCVLLKGPCTVVTDGTATYLVDRGCPGMATAGSGDVLSGVAAATLANSVAVGPDGVVDPCFALACAAYINGYAGELAQRQQSAVSMVASDTARAVADAIHQILSSRS